MHLAGRRPTNSWLWVAALSGLTSCRDPTSVTLVLSSDVACSDQPVTTVAVSRATNETLAPELVTSVCQPDGHIGTVVVVPVHDRNEQLRLRVVTRVGEGTACEPPTYGPGCIVSRRQLRFIAHEALTLPIVQRVDCAGVACEATTTCRQGTCVQAQIDEAQCRDPDGCPLDPGPLAGSAGSAGSGGNGGAGMGGSGGGSGGGTGGQPPSADCATRYGSEASFVLCTETADFCLFNLAKKKKDSCTAICEAHGGMCLGAQENAGDIACNVSATSTLTCTSTTSANSMCLCSR